MTSALIPPMGGELPTPLAILFSMNRAMQLDSTLRSLYRHCVDADALDLWILYKTTSSRHSRQYRELFQEYNQFERIHPIQQENFRIDLLKLLFHHAFLDIRKSIYGDLSRLGGIVGRVTSRWIKPVPQLQVLFLVDDNIFVKDFSLREASVALDSEPKALGLSLRLGTNTKFCYAHNRDQKLPHFDPVVSEFLKFNWTKAEHDFHYPLEISSSLFRMEDVLPLINSRSFKNPNELEGKIAASSSLFEESHPWLLCFRRSVTFCNPVNRVQNQLLNRAGVVHEYSVDFLAEKYDKNYRIDVAAFDGFVSSGCHQEVALRFIGNED